LSPVPAVASGVRSHCVFAVEGARVIVADIDEEPARAVAAEICAAGGKAEAVR